MKIKIGENLRKLRIKNELTQEQLAEIFNVSPQAVSRWENNSTYPDINMLPSIANYYNISIDELMGMDEIRNELEINNIFSIVHEYESKDMIDEAIKTLRDAIKLYPNNYGFMSELAIALSLKSKNDSNYELINEAIAFSERVLLNSTSEKLRSTTRANLCYLYLKANENEKAVKLAKTLPHIWECREILFPEMLNNTDYVSEFKKGIITVISVISDKINNYRNHGFSENDKVLTLGPNVTFKDDFREKIDFITQFLEMSTL